MNKPKRHHIANLLDLKKLGLMDDDKINNLRQQGLVIEPRKKEVRYIPGTTLIPHFAFKNASVNKMTPEAVQLKIHVEKLIQANTVSKKQYDDAIVQAEKEEQDRIDAEKIKEIKTPVSVTKKSTKTTKKTTTKK